VVEKRASNIFNLFARNFAPSEFGLSEDEKSSFIRVMDKMEKYGIDFIPKVIRLENFFLNFDLQFKLFYLINSLQSLRKRRRAYQFL